MVKAVLLKAAKVDNWLFGSHVVLVFQIVDGRLMNLFKCMTEVIVFIRDLEQEMEYLITGWHSKLEIYSHKEFRLLLSDVVCQGLLDVLTVLVECTIAVDFINFFEEKSSDSIIDGLVDMYCLIWLVIHFYELSLHVYLCLVKLNGYPEDNDSRQSPGGPSLVDLNFIHGI